MGGFNPRQMQELVQQARQQYEDLQRRMQETVVEFSSGGGGVTVKMNGRKELISVTIDPELVKSGDVEMIQDLVTAAVNGAAHKVEESLQSNLGGMLGGLGGMMGL
ncbi:MAG TPA: YbaB/EbfC family nucleoid-associated protein [Terriglobales bacterium]|nr:YbaB/EbfC family nucleoid-associated protein [Terriglobales bacterium]